MTTVTNRYNCNRFKLFAENLVAMVLGCLFLSLPVILPALGVVKG